MPTLSGFLQPEGALVTVTIGLDGPEVQRLRQAGRWIPQAVILPALLDTGAECSCVDPRAVTALALPVANIALANVPALGGVAPTFQRQACLTIVHPSDDSRLDLVAEGLLMAEIPLNALGYYALVGRDVLGKCRFLYDGQRGRFRLEY